MSKFTEKLSSGRFFSTVMVITTYCVVIIGSTAVTVLGKMSIETFMALLTGFSGLAILIAKSYFDVDRKKENGS